MNIGQIIRFRRHQQRMTQRNLAQEINKNHSWVSLMERNKRNCSIKSLKKIAESLNIPLFILIFLASDKNELKGLSAEVIEKLSKFALFEGKNNE